MRLIDADKLLELMKDQKEREIGAYAKRRKCWSE